MDKMLPIGLLLVLAIWLPASVLGQLQVDSVRSLLSTAEQSERSALLGALGVDYLRNGDYRKAKLLLDSAQAELTADAPPQFAAKLLNNRAICAGYLGNAAESISLQRQAMSIYEGLGNDSLTGQALLNLGLAYKRLDAYPTAIQYLTDAERILTPRKQLKVLAATYNALGNIHKEMGNFSEAVAMHKEALNIRTQLDHQTGIAKSLHSLGQLSLVRDELDEAEEYLTQALALKRELGKPNQLASTLSQMGLLRIAQDSLAIAHGLLSEALALREQTGDQKGRAASYSNLAKWALAKSQFDTAHMMLDSAMVISERIADLSVLVSVLESRLSLLKKTDQPHAALKVYEMLLIARDSVLNKQRIGTIARLRTEFDVERKEDKIARQQSALSVAEIENRNLWIISVIILAILLVVGLLWRKSVRQQREIGHQNVLLEESRTQTEVLHRELIHRTKNNFSALAGIVHVQREGAASQEVQNELRDLSGRLEAMSLAQNQLHLSNNNDLLIRLASYLEEVTDNALLLHKLDRNKIDLDEEIDHLEMEFDRAMRVGLITNELLTNALKHGFEPGKRFLLHLRLLEEEGWVKLTLKNPLALFGNSVQDGTGLTLIKEIAQQLDGNFEYSIDSGHFVACLSIPLKKAKG